MLQIAPQNSASVETKKSNYGTNLDVLVSVPPLLNCEVCVIVPVRNEKENLEKTLFALANQIDFDGDLFDKKRYEIIVLANNCSDNSAAIARQFAQSNPNVALHIVEMTLDRDRAYIGWVRKALMDEAYRRLKSLGRDRSVIASTDGDTQVSPTWIAAILNEINNGSDAVGGRILTAQAERLTLDRATRLYFLRYVAYRYLTAQLEGYLAPNPFDPLPRHHQHFGANLAVTVQMYERVGGLPPVRTPEDVAFYEALNELDARFRHSPTVQVYTSARVIGRANAGLSHRLAQLEQMGKTHRPMLVESAIVLANRFRLRHQLREFWQRTQDGEKYLPIALTILAQKLGIDAHWLADTIFFSPTFGLLVQQIGQHQQQDIDRYLSRDRMVDIKDAIADLRKIINNLNSFKEIEPILLFAQPF
jgi:glycosyltransferase involved in cell wall biosynthesis